MKLIQICASHNDLFGLTDNGRVYQYDFHANTWIRLARRRQDRTAAFSDGAARQGPSEVTESRGGRAAGR